MFLAKQFGETKANESETCEVKLQLNLMGLNMKAEVSKRYKSGSDICFVFISPDS